MSARILIIEDNPTSMALMIFLLESSGYQVRSAADGEDGWQAVQQEQSDLIICNLHLSYEMVRRLKNDPNLQPIPVIAVTALARASDRQKLLEAGFNGYLGKPIEPATFISQIEQFLPATLRPQRGDDASFPAAPLRPRKGMTILVVDDSSVNRELIRCTLEPFGFLLLFAADVEQGWQRAQSEPIDLILCDLHMPGENGFGLIKRVRTDSRLAALPFMFLTASSGSNSDPTEAMALGAARFLRRPIEPQALIDQIVTCLHEYKVKAAAL
jgi:two-component system, cell cycle response regulator